MSINRMMMRLSAIGALKKIGRSSYATMVNEHVYDSRISPVENLRTDEVLPMVVVYTDYDKNFIAGAGRTDNNKERERRTTTLTLEMIFCAFAVTRQIVNGQPEEVVEVSQPVTDSELEIALDILEHQCFEALNATNIAAETYKLLTGAGYKTIISRRGATPEGGQKLAARQITIEAFLNDEINAAERLSTFGPFLDTLAAEDPDYAHLVPRLKERLAGPGTETPLGKYVRLSRDTVTAATVIGYGNSMALLPAPPIIWLNGSQQ